ncbi:hypothetical protein FQR65_LT13420 [Abscondita terminalis]|nr:hypothetical protein FQR65_LT13420 [Abscondita terminalis]
MNQVGESSSYLYYVVEFPDEIVNGDVPMSVISHTWVTRNEMDEPTCLWPQRATDNQRIQMRRNHEIPNIFTAGNHIRIKYKSSTYEKALSKMKELEDVQSVVQSAPSDLDTRKRGKPKHYDDFTSSAESEVDLPVVNLKTKRRKKLTDIETFNNSRKSAMSNRATLKPVPEEPATSRDGDVEPFLDHFNDVPSTHSNTPTSWQSSSSCNCRSNEDINESELGKTFPFTTEKKLEEFNDVVTERASDLISYFQLIGGKDVVDTTRRILAKIVGQNLAESYNWCGKNKKPAFNKLKNIINFIIVIMSRKSILSIGNIVSYFDSTKLITKGENSYCSGHVQKPMFDASFGVIRSEVLASMKKKAYKVEVGTNILTHVLSLVEI